MALGCEESLWTHWILLSSVQGRSVLFLFYHCSFPAITIVFIKEWWTFIRILLHSEKNSSFLFLRWSSDNHPPPHHPLVMWPRAHSVNSSVLKRSEKVTASPLIVKVPALQTPPTARSQMNSGQTHVIEPVIRSPLTPGWMTSRSRCFMQLWKRVIKF